MDVRSNLSEGIIGAIQWTVTGFYSFLIVFSLVGWYLSATRRVYSVDGTLIALAFLVVVAVGGFVRGQRNPAGHRTRIEVLVWLFILGFVLPMVPYLSLSLSGVSESDVPFFAIPIGAYTLTLLVAYGVVYRLDVRVFLPEGTDFAREP